MKKNITSDGRAPTTDEAHDAVTRVVSWDGLAGSDRLRGLLAFLVEETLAGRGDGIRAKTIALDHYGYAPDELADRESVVRVDAGRLRRKLEEYYRETGARDPVAVMLPKGSYRPQFEWQASEDDQDPAEHRFPTATRRALSAAAFGAIAILGLVSLVVAFGQNRNEADTNALSEAERTAVFEISPARLQAIDLAESGRDLIFPAVDPERLRAALIVFEAAIEADPEYAGGHAGAAQVVATIALVQPDNDPARLVRARTAAERALSLAPEDAWSQVAMAWVAYVSGDCAPALVQSNRAMRLSPLDPHIVEFEALISLFCGEFDRVITGAEGILDTLGADTGFVFTNALGSARFHKGDDLGAIAAFEEVVARGGPTGPISMAYLMAAHHRLGWAEQAGLLAEKFEAAWPGNRIDLLFERLFDDPSYARELVEAMQGAGWSGG